VNIDKTTSIKSEEKRKWKSVSLSDEKFDEFAAKHENDDDEQNHEKGMFKKRHGLNNKNNLRALFRNYEPFSLLMQRSRFRK